MEAKLIDFYRNELKFLKESGREFAEVHPDEAKRLGLTGGDAHVERLLQGVAFLTARIRAKIEDEFPEVTEALLGILDPDAARPTPSMSIIKVEVSPEQSSALREGPRIEARERLKTRQVIGQQTCEFRTAYEVRLWPIELGPPRSTSQLSSAEAVGGAQAIVSLPIRCIGGAKFGDLGPDFDALRFHLGGEGRSPFVLRERLFHDAIRVEIRPVGAGDVPPLVFGQDELAKRLRPVGFGPDEGLVPTSGRSLLGSRNLREYFTFPEKFLFFDLTGLGPLRGWKEVVEAELRIVLKKPLDADIGLSPRSFQLYCTPIANLFRKDCSPILMSGTEVEYPVEPDIDRRLELEIYSIEEVRSESGPFRPFYTPGFAGRERSSPTFWMARRTPSVAEKSKKTNVSLCFVDADARPKSPRGRRLSVEALCTNLDLPTRLPVVDLEPHWRAANGAIRQISPLTRAWPPPIGPDAEWRLIAALALNHLPLDGGAEVLRMLLEIHCPTDEAANQIEGIAGVSCKPDVAYLNVPGLKLRGVVGGVRTTIEFDEGKYGRGYLLLAEVLEHFLGHFVSINSFSRLVAKPSGGKEHPAWPARAGDRILI